MKTALVVIGVLALLGVAAMAVFVFVVQNVEQPRYAVLRQDGAFELRTYPPLVSAEVRRHGSRREALSAGFGPLARYIFAKERAGERIAMTAPVTQERREQIGLTSPVAEEPIGGGDWAVRFFMPAGYDLDRLPAPARADVRLIRIPARRVATVRFSGAMTDELIAARESALRTWMTARGLSPAAGPTYAYYNDPLTPGFLRRNEVMIEVADGASTQSAGPR